MSVHISFINKNMKKSMTYRTSMIKWVRFRFFKTAEVEKAISKHAQ
jgi:hypothetical protein